MMSLSQLVVIVFHVCNSTGFIFKHHGKYSSLLYNIVCALRSSSCFLKCFTSAVCVFMQLQDITHTQAGDDEL